MNKRASEQANKQGDKTNKRGVWMWDALHTMHFETANAQMNHFFDFRNPCNTRNHPHHSLKSILRRNPLHSKCITGTDCTSGHPMDLAVPLPCWPCTMKKSVPAIHAPLFFTESFAGFYCITTCQVFGCLLPSTTRQVWQQTTII